MIHHLKIKKKHADAICAGAKTFEVRREDDKHFEEGDIIIFKVADWDEYEHPWHEDHHRIEERAYFVSYALRHKDFPEGIAYGYCVFTIVPLDSDIAYYYTHDMERKEE